MFGLDSPENLLKPMKNQHVYVLGHLGPSWAVLGAHWGRHGSVLGASWAVLGRLVGVLGCLGASWGRLGGVLEASWGVQKPFKTNEKSIFWF